MGVRAYPALRTGARRVRFRLSFDQRRQRYVRIREPAHVDRVAIANDRLDRLGDIPNVDVHTGEDTSPVKPEGDELRGGDVSAEYHLVVSVGFDVARVLNPHVVLVGEKYGIR